GRGFVLPAPADRAKADMPRLLDAKGKACDLVEIARQKTEIVEGKTVEKLTLVYRRQEGQGEPARLVVEGRRWASFQVPFTLKDVPLPCFVATLKGVAQTMFLSKLMI